MSKIDEMLKNEKVEWKKLWEVATVSGAGVDKKKNNNEKEILLLNYMDIYNNLYIDKNIPTMIVTASDKKINECNIEYGDIFITPSSETKEDIFRSSVAIEDFPNTVYSYHIMRIRLKNKNFITSSYLSYVFSGFKFRDKMQKKVFGNTRQTITKTEIENLEVPIPSLEIQEKIVNYLDKFTNYKENIKQELQKELSLRNKQYEYYRDKLISEEHLNKLISNYDLYKYELKETTLGELCDTRNGYTPSKSNKEYWENGEIPWFRMEDIRLNGNILNDSTIKVNKIAIKNSLFKRNSIILSTSATIGEHALIEVDFLANQRFTVFTVKNEFERLINIKFFYYYFYVIDNLCKKYLKLGNFASVDIDKLKNSKIFIPPIEIQEIIVEILDKFQASTQDVSGLLPDEIEKREKQYEYYREKLLTFDTECTSGGGTTY